MERAFFNAKSSLTMMSKNIMNSICVASSCVRMASMIDQAEAMSDVYAGTRLRWPRIPPPSRTTWPHCRQGPRPDRSLCSGSPSQTTEPPKMCAKTRASMASLASKETCCRIGGTTGTAGSVVSMGHLCFQACPDLLYMRDQRERRCAAESYSAMHGECLRYHRPQVPCSAEQLQHAIDLRYPSPGKHGYKEIAKVSKPPVHPGPQRACSLCLEKLEYNQADKAGRDDFERDKEKQRNH